MGDIISRIVLQAQGGDAVAAEYRKITKAANEASRASQGIGVGGGVAPAGAGDAFSRATGSDARTHTATRESRNAEHARSVARREQAHIESQNKATARNAFQLVNQTTGAIAQVGAGDPIGGGAGLMQTAASKMGAWGVAIAAVVGAAVATNKLAKGEADIMKQIWTSGVGPKLGEQNYDKFYEKIFAMKRAGYQENVLPFLQTFAAAGGRALGQDELKSLLSLQYTTGLDVSSLSTFVARTQQAGAGISATGISGMAQGAFGRGQMGLFYDTVASAVESGMDRGFLKGSDSFVNAYTGIAQKLSDLSIYGKLTAQGAVATYGAVQRTIAGTGAGLKRPEDVAQFMMFRKPGESHIETIKRMSEFGSEEQIFANLQAIAGGDKTTLIEMAMQHFGFSDYRQAEAWVNSMTGRQAKNAADSLARDKAAAAASKPGATKLKVQPLKPYDTTITDKVLATMQAEGTEATIGDQVKGVAGEIKRGVNKAIFGDPNYKAPAYNLMYQGMTQAVQGTGGFVGQLPSGMQGFGAYSLGPNAPVTKRVGNPIFDQFLPMMAMYEQWSAGKLAVSSVEDIELRRLAPTFESIKTIFNTQGASLSSPQGLYKLSEAIYEADVKNKEDEKGIITVVDILKALQMIISSNILTDTGTTEK